MPFGPAAARTTSAAPSSVYVWGRNVDRLAGDWAAKNRARSGASSSRRPRTRRVRPSRATTPWSNSLVYTPLLLEAGHVDPLDEGLLGEEEQDDDGRYHGGRGRHEQRPLGAVLREELAQAERERERRLVVQVDQRAEKILPV